jgi:glycosyltransferase involved in cell wall biosynthesis
MIGGRTGSSDPTNASYVSEIDDLIAELNLAAHVFWTGYVDDDQVTAYLAASDLVVLPFRDGASYRRGSLMAAIQQGCAIVTTQPNVRIPTFRHGENMMLLRAGNTEALVTTLEQLYGDPDLRKALRAGAVGLQQNFDWTSIAQGYVRLFERLIGNNA